MKIDSQFLVPRGMTETWPILLDVPGIARCMPGARLTQVIDDRNFAGEMAVKLGPISLKFGGRAEITERDDKNYKATVKAKGADHNGRGTVTANVHFQLNPEGDATRVSILTDLNLTGSVAQYGRGSNMIIDVANILVGQFAKNLHAKINDVRETAGATASYPETNVTAQAAAGSQNAPLDAGRLGFLVFYRACSRWLRRLFGRSD